MASYNNTGSLPLELGKPPQVVLEWRQGEQHAVRVRDVVVYEFSMGDVEDPDLYAATPILDWEHSEPGQWVLATAVETPFWRRVHNIIDFGYRYQIVARLREPDEVFWRLKFGIEGK